MEQQHTPHQETTLPPPSEPVSHPSSPTEPHPEKPSVPKWVWIVAISFVGFLLIAGVAFGLLSGLYSKSNPNDTKQNASLTTFTVGEQPYIYACNVAKEGDFEEIFGLNGKLSASVTQTGALSVGEVGGEQSDLSKRAPSLLSRYTSTCSYVRSAEGSKRVTTMEVRIGQFATPDDAASAFKGALSTATGDFTRDDIDNGTVAVGKLPTFSADKNFVRLPSGDAQYIKASFVEGAKLVELTYDFNDPETYDTTLPKLDQFAQRVATSIKAYNPASGPLDHTNSETATGKKFVDICRTADLRKVTSILGNVDIRPDEMTSISTFASMPGSLAEKDGVVSSCQYKFRTQPEKQAQEQILSVEPSKPSSRTPSLYADDMWLYTLEMRANSFKTPDEATAFLAAQKDRLAKRKTNATSNVVDVQDLGDQAFKYTNQSSIESSFNGESTSTMISENLYLARFGNDVVGVAIGSTDRKSNFKLSPLNASEDQFVSVVAYLNDVLAPGR